MKVQGNIIIDFRKEWMDNEGNPIFQSSQGTQKSEFNSILSFLRSWTDDTATIEVSSSGSTGLPKVIPIPKVWMKKSAERSIEQLGLQEGMRALLCLSVHHIGGMMMVVRSIIARMELTCVLPSSHPHTERPVDFTAMVPLQVQALTNSGNNLSSFGTLIVGGAPLSPHLESRLKDLNTPVYATFGMTETVSNIALRRINDNGSASLEFNAHQGITIGKTEEGCLTVDIPYMDNLHVETQDLVDIKPDNRFVWLGRRDNVINSGGVKLQPELIEQKMASFIEGDFFMSVQTHDTLGQCAVLCIEAGDFQDGLLNNIEASLLPYERPWHIYLSEGFSRTETGKIQRHESLCSASLVWSR